MPDIACPHCGTTNANAGAFCVQCGKALPDALATGPRIVTDEALASTTAGRSVQSDQLRKKAGEASRILIALGVLDAVIGIMLYATLQGQGPAHARAAGIILAGCAGLAILFGGLGFWARVNPLPASIVGLVVFLTLQIASVVMDPASLRNMIGLFIRIFIIVALCKAVSAGVKYKQLMAQSGQ